MSMTDLRGGREYKLASITDSLSNRQCLRCGLILRLDAYQLELYVDNSARLFASRLHQIIGMYACASSAQHI